MKKQPGFTLIEVVVALGVISIFFVGIISGIQLLFRLVEQSRVQTIETAVLSEQIDLLRHVPYTSLGIASGTPSGVFARTVTTTKNNRVFQVTRTVRFVDDPFDGEDPVDLDPNDYKFIQVDALCVSCNQVVPQSAYTVVVP